MSRRPLGERRRLVRAAVAYGLVLLLNDLGGTVWAMLANMGQAKVLNSLAGEMAGLALRLLGVALAMLGLAAAASLLAGLVLGAVHRAALEALAPRTRAGRMALHAAVAFALLGAWYSLHGLFVPGSQLAGSPLAMLTGALTGPQPLEAGRYALPSLQVAAGAGLLALALVSSRAARRAILPLAAGLVAANLGWSALAYDREPRPFTQPGNVVLLGLDSLQSNRLAAGGAPWSQSPAVDAFLAKAFVFGNAWTPFARTYPSWISILTGRDPPHHGARFNLAPDGQLAGDNAWLPMDLAARGYTTLHATDETHFCILREKMGYQRLVTPRMGAVDFLLCGFLDLSAANLARRTHLGHDLFVPLALNRAAPAYDPDLFVDRVIAELDALPRDRPAFISIHLCGNHWPFSLPGEWLASRADPVEACVAMTDHQAGRLLEWMERSGLAGQATTVLLSDHGDGWSGDPGDRTNSHGDDFRSLWANRAVLAFRGPGIGTGRCDAAVRTTDIAPTLREALSLPAAPGTIDGLSLAPLISGSGGEGRDVYAETGLDRKQWTIRQLVEQNVDWYDVDAESGLVHLRPEGVAEFLPSKSFLLVRGDAALTVTPWNGRFGLRAVDPVHGVERPDAPLPGPGVRAAMLADLCAHFGLDGERLSSLARTSGLLDPPIASAR